MNFKSVLLCIFFSIAIGIWSFLSLGTLLVVSFAVIVGFIIYKRGKNVEEKRFLKQVFMIALLLSLLLACLNFYSATFFKSDSDVIGDASAYSCHGVYIAEVLTNKRFNTGMHYVDMEELEGIRQTYQGSFPGYGDYRMGFFAYAYGFLYVIFGYSPLIFKFINVMLGVIGCFLIYFWMRDTFGVKPAQIALILVLFLPSRLMWSTSGLKDVLVFFSFSIILFSFYQMRKESNFAIIMLILVGIFAGHAIIYSVLSIIGAVIFIKHKRKALILLGLFLAMKLGYILLYSIRFHFVYPLLMVLGVSTCIFLSKRQIAVFVFSTIILLVSLLSYIGPVRMRQEYKKHTSVIIDIQTAQAKAGSYARSRYSIYPKRFNEKKGSASNVQTISFRELFVSYLIGMCYHFLSPFPWSVASEMQVLGLAQSVCIYFLIPFIFLGIFVGFRYHWREVLPFFLLVFVVGSINALLLGNMGTLFRHKDMVMPFFIAFGAVGIIKAFGLGGLILTKKTDER